MAESLGEEPDREDELEEPAWGDGNQSGAHCHVGDVEQDRKSVV